MFNFIFKIERWKFNKTYQVYASNQGRFRNKSKADIPIKIGKGGYCYVKVECSTCEYILAHRLVMLTWKPTPDAENLTVDHKDHNKRNNALSNLEWVSYEENQERAKDDLIEVISKEAFNKLVEAEVLKRLGIDMAEAEKKLSVNAEGKPKTQDIMIYTDANKTPRTLSQFIDEAWDKIHPSVRVKCGNTKMNMYRYLVNKIIVNKQKKLNYFSFINQKVYF